MDSYIARIPITFQSLYITLYNFQIVASEQGVFTFHPSAILM